MAWNESVVTAKGSELMAECVLAGGSIEITSAVGGESCSPAVSLMAAKEIAPPVHNLQIAKIEKIKNSVTVNVRVQNNGLVKAYTIRQIGIFARIKDSGEQSVLLALIQDQEGERIPYEEENPEFLLEYDFVIPVSNAEDISINVTPNTFATLDDISKFTAHIEDDDRHITSEERTAWNGKAAGNHTHSAASQSAAGFMSADDKKKLDGVAAGANSYTHPVTSGNKHIPSGGASGQILRWSADGTAAWGNDNNTTYSNMTGASASAAGKAGLVPAPAAGKQTSFLRGDGTWVIPTNTTYSAMTGATANTAGKTGLVPAPAKGYQAKYLRGDGTWQTPPDTNTTYSAATQSAAGLMLAEDKKKLDGVAASANNYAHPAYTARTGVPTANQTPAFGGTFSVSQPVSDASGHITALNARTVKIPNTAASQSAAGLMSAADKKKLDGVTLASPVYMTASMGAAISFAVPAGAKAAIVSLRTVDTSSNSSFGHNTIMDVFVDVIDVTAGDVSIPLYFNDEYHRIYGALKRSNGNASHGIISLKNNAFTFTVGSSANSCNDIPVNGSTYSTTFSVMFI